MPVVNGFKAQVGGGWPGRVNADTAPDGGVSAAPEPWVPKVGDRVRNREDGRYGCMVPPCNDFHKHRVLYDSGGTHDVGPFRRFLEVFELVSPSVLPAVAAVVVRGLACGETARVVLCASEEEAVREQRANGGIVVAGGQVVWA